MAKDQPPANPKTTTPQQLTTSAPSGPPSMVQPHNSGAPFAGRLTPRPTLLWISAGLLLISNLFLLVMAIGW